MPTSIYPSLILNQLLIAWPEPVSIEDLHYAVWGCQYEAELDEQAFKTLFIGYARIYQLIQPEKTAGHAIIGGNPEFQSILWHFA